MLSWPFPLVSYTSVLAVLFPVSSSDRSCRCGLCPVWFSFVGETAAALLVEVSKSFSLPNGWFDVNGYRDVCPGRQEATGCHPGPDTIRPCPQGSWCYSASRLNRRGSIWVLGGESPSPAVVILQPAHELGSIQRPPRGLLHRQHGCLGPWHLLLSGVLGHVLWIPPGTSGLLPRFCIFQVGS